MGSSAFGGFLYSRIGLEPLIVLSAGFSLLVLFLIPHLPDHTVGAENISEGRAS
jgi:hypothetical protein